MGSRAASDSGCTGNGALEGELGEPQMPPISLWDREDFIEEVTSGSSLIGETGNYQVPPPD